MSLNLAFCQERFVNLDLTLRPKMTLEPLVLKELTPAQETG